MKKATHSQQVPKKQRPNINISFNIISNNFLSEDAMKKKKNKMNFKQSETNEFQQNEKRNTKSALEESYSKFQGQQSRFNFKKHQRKPCSMDMQQLQRSIQNKQQTDLDYQTSDNTNFNKEKPKQKKKSKSYSKSKVKNGKKIKKSNEQKGDQITFIAPYSTQFSKKTANKRSVDRSKESVKLENLLSQYRKGKITLAEFKKNLLNFTKNESFSKQKREKIYHEQLETEKLNTEKYYQRFMPHKQKRSKYTRSQLGSFPQSQTVSFTKKNAPKTTRIVNVQKGSIIETVIHIKDFESSVGLSENGNQENEQSQQLLSSFSSACESGNKKNLKIKTTQSAQKIRKNLQTSRQQIKKNKIKFAHEKVNNKEEVSFEDVMALKIQRAWKQYKTRKLISNMVGQLNQKLETQLHSSGSLINRVLLKQQNAEYIEKMQSQKKGKYFTGFEMVSSKQQTQQMNNSNDEMLQQSKPIVDSKKDKLKSMIKRSLQAGNRNNQRECLNDIIEYLQYIKKQEEQSSNSNISNGDCSKSKEQKVQNSNNNNNKTEEFLEIELDSPKVQSKIQIHNLESDDDENINKDQISKLGGDLVEISQSVGINPDVPNLLTQSPRSKKEGAFLDDVENQFEKILYGSMRSYSGQNDKEKQIPFSASGNSPISFDNESNHKSESRKLVEMMNFNLIEDTLNKKIENLKKKQQHELSVLYTDLEDSIISEGDYKIEKSRVRQRYKRKKIEITKVKNQLNKSYYNARKIIDKQSNSLQNEERNVLVNKKRLSESSKKSDEESLSSSDSNNQNLNHYSGLSRCLSQSYLKRKVVDFQKLFGKEQQNDGQEEKDPNLKNGKNKNRHLRVECDDSASSEEVDDQLINMRYEQLNRQFTENDNEQPTQHQYQEQIRNAQRNFQGLDQLDRGNKDKASNKVSLRKISQIQKQKQKEKGYNISQAAEISLFNFEKDPKDKLKKYTRDDKQNAFEFLFLDLCLEMFLQVSQNSKINTAVSEHIKQVKRLKSIPKGVKTNLNSVKQYLDLVVEHVLKNEFNLLKNLQSPIGPTAIEMLRYMHEFQDDQNIDDPIEESVTLIIPTGIFQEFERISQSKFAKFEKCFADQIKEKSRQSFLKSVLHVHHKAIFDCLNEFLDYQRCFGIWGKPFPWKVHVVKTEFDDEQRKKKLKKSSERVAKVSTYLVGVLVDKEDSIFKNHSVSEDYLKDIREDRLAKMLANDLLETQDRWMFYDDEETEVLIEATSFIFSQLRKEVAKQIQQIQRKRTFLY